MKSAYTQYHLTPAQRKALEAYRFAEKEEGRYMGSRMRKHQEATATAYQACKALGMTHAHGL